jgi:hypothetical protein
LGESKRIKKIRGREAGRGVFFSFFIGYKCPRRAKVGGEKYISLVKE